MILFLDFDGVLHPTDRRFGTLSCLPTFEAVLRELPDIDVVISSSWRSQYSLLQLRELFSPDIAFRVIDTTPDRASVMDIIEPYRRQREIEDWLRENGREYEPWIALDDCAWMFSSGCTQLLCVDPAVGFNDNSAGALQVRLSQRRAT